ncbi:MAG: Dna2/Cas4 domain-containing protein [Acidobacteria bacterium]|nr:Dna2/Cas4 domain-containing protein [Acidobacteriota bacterium]
MDQSVIFTILFAALLLLVASGAALLVISRRLGQESGMPRGEVFYDDASGHAEGQLYSTRLLMVGKPDYLMKDKNGNLVPVEVKSGDAPRAGRPYESHLMQLAAYFFLIEDVMQRPVPYGLIRYRNRTLRIANTDELRARLMDVIAEMRRLMARGAAHRNHNQTQRCSRCSMAHACDERLG